MMQILEFVFRSTVGLVAVSCAIPTSVGRALPDPATPTAYVCTIRLDETQFVATGEIFQLVTEPQPKRRADPTS